MKLENSNFTIYEVEDVKNLFQTLLMEKDKIVVDFENISKIDMSAIQLLLSLKKTSLEHNKSFQIINMSDDIAHAFNISGCAYILGV